MIFMLVFNHIFPQNTVIMVFSQQDAFVKVNSVQYCALDTGQIPTHNL